MLRLGNTDAHIGEVSLQGSSRNIIVKNKYNVCALFSLFFSASLACSRFPETHLTQIQQVTHQRVVWVPELFRDDS